uniref:EGF-like domain-containing protein n=1 Tax=Myripristis murdjan TaxID=586833 RepID=A0A667Y2H7_9TELE
FQRRAVELIGSAYCQCEDTDRAACAKLPDEPEDRAEHAQGSDCLRRAAGPATSASQPYSLVTMVHCNLLLAAWLCSLLTLVAQVQSCPDTCRICSGPENTLCLECEAGFTLHDNTCVDIDECGTELGMCTPNSYCFNIEGSYECRACAHCYVVCFFLFLCSDVDECSDRVLPCPGLDEICSNTEGSFRCDCAKGFIRRDRVCVEEKGLFEDIQDEEVEVLQQMFFGVLLCALATLAAKGDLVFTSIFMGAVAAMAGYWLSDRGDRFLDSFLKGR